MPLLTIERVIPLRPDAFDDTAFSAAKLVAATRPTTARTAFERLPLRNTPTSGTAHPSLYSSSAGNRATGGTNSASRLSSPAAARVASTLLGSAIVDSLSVDRMEASAGLPASPRRIFESVQAPRPSVPTTKMSLAEL